MGVYIETFDSRKEWLAARLLGGSDAPAVFGKSPHMSNVDLWEIKTGKKEAPDLSDNPLVAYGTAAEEHLRKLFRLDFPEYTVLYEPYNLWKNTDWPHATASLDFWMYDGAGRLGVGEIKTATIQSAAQGALWDKRVPAWYYIQVLHNMGVSGADFAILAAQLKWERDGDVLKVTKHYKVEAEAVRDDIDLVMKKGAAFWDHVRSNTRPGLVLPEI